MGSRRSAIKMIGAVLATASLPMQIQGSRAYAASKTVKLTGPIQGGVHGWPFRGYLGDIGSVGYTEEEYVLEGQATRYKPVGELTIDGKWNVEPAGKAPFKTRMIVQLPKDSKKFNGTVLLEWNNVSSGYDVLVHNQPGVYEAGFAYIALTTQYVGIHGLPPKPQGLVQWDPQRYGTLTHPGDSYCYDIYSQGGRAVGPKRSRKGTDPLHGLQVQKIIAVGSSQSAARLTTYANAIQLRDHVFDAILLGTSFGNGALFSDTVLNLFDPEKLAQARREAMGGPVRIREDLDIPVMIVASEQEALPYAPVRQPDTDRFRHWEIAGASHFPEPMLASVNDIAKRDFGEALNLASAGLPSRVGWVDVLDAATQHVDRWIKTGAPPPTQPPIELAGTPPQILRDENGIAKGGVRKPDVEVPIASNSGVANNGLLGHCEPFGAKKLRALYPTHKVYVDKVTAAARAAGAAGIILPRTVEQYIAEATAADIPPKA